MDSIHSEINAKAKLFQPLSAVAAHPAADRRPSPRPWSRSQGELASCLEDGRLAMVDSADMNRCQCGMDIGV